MLKTALLSFFLAITAGLAIWTTYLSYSAKEPNKKSSILPDAYLLKVTATSMDKAGKPSIKVETPKLIHYFTNDHSQFIKPRITVYLNALTPWHINAERGEAVQGTHEIIFEDNVNIYHAAEAHQPETTITTAKLTVDPNARTAYTAAPIQMQQPDLKVFGVGMQANMRTGDIKILSATRGEYASKLD